MAEGQRQRLLDTREPNILVHETQHYYIFVCLISSLGIYEGQTHLIGQISQGPDDMHIKYVYF